MNQDALQVAVDKAAAARKAAEQAQDELNEAIRQALQSPDIKTKQIVEITGLTRSRIYQIRDHRR